MAAAAAAFPAWRRLAARRSEILFRIRQLVDEHRRDLAARRRPARQGHLGRPRRGRPGDREHRVRVRRAEPAQGWVQRAGLDRRRRVLDPPATGVVAGITPFNFPAMVPMWMFANAHRLRQRVRPQAVREGPRRVDADRRATQGGRAPGRRVQRRPRRQGGRRPDPRAPGHQGRVVRRLDPDRPLHLRDWDAQRQACPGPRRGEEPHDRAARRGH